MNRLSLVIVVAGLTQLRAGTPARSDSTPDYASMLLQNQSLLANPPASCDATKAALSTFALQQCSAQAFKAADAAMVRAFAAAAQASDPGRLARLKTTQKLWLAWRNSECDWRSSRYTGGTLAPVVMGSCLVDVTRARTKDLADDLLP